jgi:alkanesulfonate monooxygenase SsuD/methylene tetrahydromethanopterin reductase-like flavin-dependent oxidoreductase (luciferase family)
VGITLPTFTDDASRATAAAQRAEALGLDGVFVFDHLWPLGQPHRPALHGLTMLGAVAAATTTITVGPLVARVGLLPDAVLVNTLRSVGIVSDGRLLAALGTGDSGNRPENEAYGVPFEPAEDRLTRLRSCLEELAAAGISTWAGGRSPALREVAAAAAGGLNVWGATLAEVADEGADARRRAAGRALEVTWAGQVLLGASPGETASRLERSGSRPGLVAGTPTDLAAHFDALAAVGATWAVCAPLDHTDPEALELIAEAAHLSFSRQ